MRHFTTRLAALFGLVVLVGCNCGEPPADKDPTLDPAASTLTAESPIVADGVSTGRITATIVDGEGNTLPGVSVQFESSREVDQVTQPSGPTDADGVARGSILSTEPGQVVITAVAGDETLENTASVTFLEPCGPGEDRCDGICTNLNDDPENCGVWRAHVRA